MATSKTLTPTNVTIQIPAMTDAPDQSVNSNCIDKLGDAVNTLNSQIIDRIKCIRMDVELDAQGVWGAWNYNIGYTNYQLLKAFVFTWNNVTVIGANNGFWNIKVDGLASQTVNVCFVIASAIIPNS